MQECPYCQKEYNNLRNHISFFVTSKSDLDPDPPGSRSSWIQIRLDPDPPGSRSAWIRVGFGSLVPDPYRIEIKSWIRSRKTCCAHAGMPLLPEGVQQSARPYQAWSPQACPAGIPHVLPIPKLQLQDVFRYQESYQVPFFSLSNNILYLHPYGSPLICLSCKKEFFH
jgi:hypothetical protein